MTEPRKTKAEMGKRTGEGRGSKGVSASTQTKRERFQAMNKFVAPDNFHWKRVRNIKYIAKKKMVGGDWRHLFIRDDAAYYAVFLTVSPLSEFCEEVIDSYCRVWHLLNLENIWMVELASTYTDDEEGPQNPGRPPSSAFGGILRDP